MELFFVDKVLPFLKKNQSLEQLEKLTLFQFYLLRFGIGLTITKKIINLSGVHFSYRIKNYIPTIINQNIKFIFIKTTNMLDLYLQQKMVERIKLDIKLYSYRGDRYNLRLPLHGQRRRANSKTVKKVRNLIL